MVELSVSFATVAAGAGRQFLIKLNRVLVVNRNGSRVCFDLFTLHRPKLIVIYQVLENLLATHHKLTTTASATSVVLAPQRKRFVDDTLFLPDYSPSKKRREEGSGEEGSNSMEQC